MAAKSPLKQKPNRLAGQSLDEQLDKLVSDKALAYLFLPAVFWLIAGLEWFAQWKRMPRQPATFAIAALVLTLFGGWRLRQIFRKAKQIKLGRDGERLVAQTLQTLRVGHLRVLNDLICDDFNIDHVVICERGVFVVETKTWTKPRSDARIQVRDGKILKDGRPVDRDPIRQVVASANWLSVKIEAGAGPRIAVWGVVAIPNWFIENKDPPSKAQAWVLEPKALIKWIEKEPVVLTPDRVNALAFFMEQYFQPGN